MSRVTSNKKIIQGLLNRGLKSGSCNNSQNIKLGSWDFDTSMWIEGHNMEILTIYFFT